MQLCLPLSITLTSYNDHVFSSQDHVKVKYELNKFLLKDDACMINYHVLKEKVDFSPTYVCVNNREEKSICDIAYQNYMVKNKNKSLKPK